MEAATIVIKGRLVDETQLAELCRRCGVEELAVFGSVACGEAEPSSDIDLLYQLAPDARLGFAINALEDELSTLFGRPVDLVSKRALLRLIRDDVLASLARFISVTACCSPRSWTQRRASSS